MRVAVAVAALVLSSAVSGLAQPRLANQLPMRVGDVVSISAVVTGYEPPARDPVSCMIVTFADVPFVSSPNVLLTTSSVNFVASPIWVENRRFGLCVNGTQSAAAPRPLDIHLLIQGAVPGSTAMDVPFHLLATPVGGLDELLKLRSR